MLLNVKNPLEYLKANYLSITSFKSNIEGGPEYVNIVQGKADIVLYQMHLYTH